MSPDGTRLVLGEDNSDLMMLGLDDGRRAAGSSTPSQRFGEARPLVQTSFVEYNADISADGTWLAYQSNNSGAFEVHVRPFPDVSGGQWQVSTAGGTEPLWARNGHELFYRAPDGSLMRVSIAPGSTWRAGTPTRLVEGQSYSYFGLIGVLGNSLRTYDVSPDGRRFLMIKNFDVPEQPSTTPRIVVVQNWSEELKRRVPTK